jgi:hypothetical protein
LLKVDANVAVAAGGDGVQVLEHRTKLPVDLVALSARQLSVELRERAARAERADQARAAAERFGGPAESQYMRQPRSVRSVRSPEVSCPVYQTGVALLRAGKQKDRWAAFRRKPRTGGQV